MSSKKENVILVICETEAGEAQVQGECGLQSEFKVNLQHLVCSCLNNGSSGKSGWGKHALYA